MGSGEHVYNIINNGIFALFYCFMAVLGETGLELLLVPVVPDTSIEIQIDLSG